ncbi:MAG: sugar phosphate isomerase/epimerase [Chloroflexi bacterium]|nr:sugar phosphate isomerase/epimerase [Chloroflexota bacterium]
MRYAFMSFSAPDASLEELCRFAQRSGYTGIEPRLGAGHAHGIEVDSSSEQRRQMRQLATDYGVELCALATSGRLADPHQPAAQRQSVRQAIVLAAEIGAPIVRVFGGPRPADTSPETARSTLIEGLGEMAIFGATMGVSVCLETHDAWSDPRLVRDVLSAVQLPAAGVVWDIMHPVRSGHSPMQAAWSLLAPWVRHVHVHDGTLEQQRLVFRPIGTGDYDHRVPLQCLKAAKYPGFISGEWINWEPAAVHLPRELAALRRLEAES